LCQQVINKKDKPNKIFGVIPYLAPEVLSKKPYTKESDIYSFGMVMWEHTTGKKPFYDRPHNHCLILDILKGERPEITNDMPEFYAELMKKCWNHDPENRPTAGEICDCLQEHCKHDRTEENVEIIRLHHKIRQIFVRYKEL
jgi:serine/threonine protein kinase